MIQKKITGIIKTNHEVVNDYMGRYDWRQVIYKYFNFINLIKLKYSIAI